MPQRTKQHQNIRPGDFQILTAAVAAGLPADFKIYTTFAFGCPLVIEKLWERLGLKKTLNRIIKKTGGNELYERALLAMVASGQQMIQLLDDITENSALSSSLSHAHAKYLQRSKAYKTSTG